MTTFSVKLFEVSCWWKANWGNFKPAFTG